MKLIYIKEDNPLLKGGVFVTMGGKTTFIKSPFYISKWKEMSEEEYFESREKIDGEVIIKIPI